MMSLLGSDVCVGVFVQVYCVLQRDTSKPPNVAGFILHFTHEQMSYNSSLNGVKGESHLLLELAVVWGS